MTDLVIFEPEALERDWIDNGSRELRLQAIYHAAAAGLPARVPPRSNARCSSGIRPSTSRLRATQVSPTGLFLTGTAKVVRSPRADRIGYICTGGGAFLEMLEGKRLPAIEILQARSAGPHN